MRKVSIFLVVRILDDRSVYIPSTKVYGKVELRSHVADTKSETEALEKSASESGLDFEKFKICARIATIVDCETPFEAFQVADRIFLEVLDFKSAEFSMSNISVSKIGFVKDLVSGHITSKVRSGFEPALTFVMNDGSMQCFDSTNFILSLSNELSERYKRSLHWSRNSKNETSAQLKIIFLWFSLEALLKESETDNCVESYIRLFLGFPNGKQLALVTPEIKSSLESHVKYEYWQRKLHEVVQEIRDFRNNSVHSGFRSMDFTKERLDLFMIILVCAVSRCQSGVARALLINIESLAKFKEYSVLLFEDNLNLINDTHNNVIHFLENPVSH